MRQETKTPYLDAFEAVKKLDVIEQLRLIDTLLSDIPYDTEFVSNTDVDRLAEIYYNLQNVLLDIYDRYEQTLGLGGEGWGGC